MKSTKEHGGKSKGGKAKKKEEQKPRREEAMQAVNVDDRGEYHRNDCSYYNYH